MFVQIKNFKLPNKKEIVQKMWTHFFHTKLTQVANPT